MQYNYIPFLFYQRIFVTRTLKKLTFARVYLCVFERPFTVNVFSSHNTFVIKSKFETEILTYSKKKKQLYFASHLWLVNSEQCHDLYAEINENIEMFNYSLYPKLQIVEQKNKYLLTIERLFNEASTQQ